MQQTINDELPEKDDFLAKHIERFPKVSRTRENDKKVRKCLLFCLGERGHCRHSENSGHLVKNTNVDLLHPHRPHCPRTVPGAPGAVFPAGFNRLDQVSVHFMVSCQDSFISPLLSHHHQPSSHHHYSFPISHSILIIIIINQGHPSRRLRPLRNAPARAPRRPPSPQRNRHGPRHHDEKVPDQPQEHRHLQQDPRLKDCQRRLPLQRGVVHAPGVRHHLLRR